MTNKSKTIKRVLISLLILGLLIAAGIYIRNVFFNPNWEITDKLDGNIFPSVILSSATSEKNVVQRTDSNMLGNPKTPFAIRIKNANRNAHLHIEIEETPFFHKSVSDLVLPESGITYLVYPDISWKYERLKNNAQAEPVDVSVSLKFNYFEQSYKHRTFSVRSVNECLLGYRSPSGRYNSTSIFFAAYVNEEHPKIETILRDALDARIVRRFEAYQFNSTERVKKQVFAVWYALQQRGFHYSSLTNSSLSSNVVYTQRVRTIDDSFESLQLNCVDGSVLFASVLRAIGIDPVLVRVPGHMFMGFYLDKRHKKCAFIETTLIGNIDLNEEEVSTGKKKKKSPSARERSLANFNRALEIGNERFKANEKHFYEGINPNYMFLKIDKSVRQSVQPIGK